MIFQSLHVADTPSPSKSAKVGKKYGLSKHTSKAKERKTKDRLVVSHRVIISVLYHGLSCISVWIEFLMQHYYLHSE